MKNSHITFLFVVFVFTTTIHSLFAQSANQISIPSTPAFSILDFEPASVLRPSNPKELSADILNSFGQDGKLSMNLGLEVAPYWLKSRPELSRDQYDNATRGQLFRQSVMLSAATVKDSVNGKNKLGAGFRFKLSQGSTTPEFQARQLELVERSTMMAVVSAGIGQIASFANKLTLVNFLSTALRGANISAVNIRLFNEIVAGLAPNFTDSQSDMTLLLQGINVEIAKKNEALQHEVIAEAKKRMGLIFEIAGAASFITTTSEEFEKAGLWLNGSQVISKTDALAFSLRTFFTSKDSATTNVDFGISYIKEVTDFSISAELVGRYYSSKIPDININNEPITRIDEDFTYRFAVQGAYKIAEGISVNLSLGKDFDKPFIGRSGFFSIFGVNYSIFKNAKAAP